MVKVIEDMTGWNMWEHGVPDSKLIVISQADDYIAPDGRHFARWECECSCEEHNRIITRGDYIRNGVTLSCGCYHREQLVNRNKDGHFNIYNLSGEYGIGWTSNTNKEFYFDLEDYDKIKDYCWLEQVSNGVSTLQAHNVKTKKMIKMHTLLGFKGYDHEDRNELNNRKLNLRKCTASENARNRSIQKNNKSGFIGVRFDKKTKKWFASVTLNYVVIRLGYFIDKEAAIKARLQAEAQYYGKFAPQRHLFEQYGIVNNL